MKIKAIKTIQSKDHNLQPGDVDDLPEKIAQNLIDRKAAVAMQEPAAEPSSPFPTPESTKPQETKESPENPEEGKKKEGDDKENNKKNKP